MLKNLKEMSGVNLLEAATLLFFLGIGYGLVYKASFYTTIGVQWFIGSLTPSYIIFSSLKYIIGGILAILIGFKIGNIIPIKYITFYNVITILFYTLFMLFLNNKIYGISFDYKGFYMLFTFFSYLVITINYISNIIFHFRMLDINNLSENKSYPNHFFFYLIFMGIATYILVPSGLGSAEAKHILNQSDESTNFVKLKDNDKKWILIDYFNDKALIKINGDEKIFRVVDYKDIEIYKNIDKRKAP